MQLKNVKQKLLITDYTQKLYKCYIKIIINWIFVIIRAYQFLISPLLGTNCKFYPSCSEYSFQAFKKYGLIKGLYFSIKRILRCNPWSKGGYEPIK